MKRGNIATTKKSRDCPRPFLYQMFNSLRAVGTIMTTGRSGDASSDREKRQKQDDEAMTSKSVVTLYRLGRWLRERR